MKIIQETKAKLPLYAKDIKNQKLEIMIKKLADQLKPGEYVQRITKLPTFFIKINNWAPELEIRDLVMGETPGLLLNNNQFVEFTPEDVNGKLDGYNQSRIVLLSTNGFSSFIVDLQEKMP